MAIVAKTVGQTKDEATPSNLISYDDESDEEKKLEPEEYNDLEELD